MMKEINPARQKQKQNKTKQKKALACNMEKEKCHFMVMVTLSRT